MATRDTKFLLKRSNVPGKIPPSSALTEGEIALNTADAILYTSGSTQGQILPIGWDRIHRTGDTMTGTLNVSTISATTYQNLPLDVFVTGGTYSAGTATFTNNIGGTFDVTGFTTSSGSDTFTGGTVTGATNFTNGLIANTFSATTYQGFASDIYPVATIQTFLQSKDFTTTTGNMNSNGLMGYFITIEKNVNIDTLYVRASTTFFTSRITYGIYNLNSLGYPDTKLFNSTEFTLAIGTVQTEAVNWSLSADTYFIAYNMNSSSGGMVGFSRYVAANTAIATTDTSLFTPRGYFIFRTYSTTLPTTFPAGATSSGTAAFNGMWFKIAP